MGFLCISASSTRRSRTREKGEKLETLPLTLFLPLLLPSKKNKTKNSLSLSLSQQHVHPEAPARLLRRALRPLRQRLLRLHRGPRAAGPPRPLWRVPAERAVDALVQPQADGALAVALLQLPRQVLHREAHDALPAGGGAAQVPRRGVRQGAAARERGAAGRGRG